MVTITLNAIWERQLAAWGVKIDGRAFTVNAAVFKRERKK